MGNSQLIIESHLELPSLILVALPSECTLCYFFLRLSLAVVTPLNLVVMVLKLTAHCMLR